MEWVEAKGRTVEVAVQAALRELGIDDPERVEVEVLQEPERGFLGLGGRDAIVRVKEKPRRRKRRARGEGGERGSGGRQGRGRQSGERRQPPREQNSRGDGRQRQGEQRQRVRGDGGRDGGAAPRRRQESGEMRAEGKEPQVTVEEQAPVVKEFLTGLVEAFGVEGRVEVRVEDDTIIAEVIGEQTEALVGPRGAVMEAVHELTKTVLQRKTQQAARVRLDVAGYAERRRQALTIYANQLIDQVMAEGGELMLEPMSAADRKVIHDAVAARPGVRSYSEGEAPSRYVVIARVPEEESAPAAEAASTEAEGDVDDEE